MNTDDDGPPVHDQFVQQTRYYRVALPARREERIILVVPLSSLQYLDHERLWWLEKAVQKGGAIIVMGEVTPPIPGWQEILR